MTINLARLPSIPSILLLFPPQVIDLTMDPGTKTFITTSDEGEVKQVSLRAI